MNLGMVLMIDYCYEQLFDVENWDDLDTFYLNKNH
jgi:hypothetical protein